MSIPSPERMRQLEAGDIALFSFGWGKPMYAGWGGIACFRDIDLADRVREIRDRWIAPESLSLRFRRSGSTLLQVAMNQRRPLRAVCMSGIFIRCTKTQPPLRIEQGPPQITQGESLQTIPGQSARELPPEWTRPMTALNRRPCASQSA